MTTTTFKATAIKIIHALNTFNISELLIFTRAFSSFIQYLPSSNFTQTNKIWICIWITSNISEESIIPSLSLSYRIHWTVYAICFTKLHDLQTKKRPRPSIREKKKNGLKTKNKNERRVYWMSIQYFQLIRPFRDNKKKTVLIRNRIFSRFYIEQYLFDLLLLCWSFIVLNFICFFFLQRWRYIETNKWKCLRKRQLTLMEAHHTNSRYEQVRNRSISGAASTIRIKTTF